MCLYKVTKTSGFNPSRVYRGYKWLNSERRSFLLGSPVMSRRWLRDRDIPGEGGLSSSNGKYPRGFHLYSRLREARSSDWGMESNRQLWAVLVRRVVARGLGDGSARFGKRKAQIVAQEIRLVRRIK